MKEYGEPRTLQQRATKVWFEAWDKYCQADNVKLHADPSIAIIAAALMAESKEKCERIAELEAALGDIRDYLSQATSPDDDMLAVIDAVLEKP